MVSFPIGGEYAVDIAGGAFGTFFADEKCGVGIAEETPVFGVEERHVFECDEQAGMRIKGEMRNGLIIEMRDGADSFGILPLGGFFGDVVGKIGGEDEKRV